MTSSGEPPPDPNEKENEWNFKANPFKLLGFNSKEDASLNPEEIRKAFKEKIRNIHPDKNVGKEGLAKRLTAAYNFLKHADADKLKALAQKFATSRYDGGQQLSDISNVILDKTKSEHYRRLFKAHLEDAKEKKFRDNFKSFYNKVFEEVETQPEVHSGFRCDLCQEDFISMEDHSQLIFDPYLEYISGEISSLPRDVEGMTQYVESILPDGKRLLTPIEIEWSTGDWNDDNKIRNYLDQWTQLFQSITKQDGVDSSILETQLKRMLQTVEDASIKFTMLLQKDNKRGKIYLVEFLSNLIQSLIVIKEQAACNIISKALPLLPFGVHVTKLNPVDLILPAFLKHYKGETSWSDLAFHESSSNARLALIMAKLDIILESKEDFFLKLGKFLLKKECEDAVHYAHLCFLLGSFDVNQVATEIAKIKVTHEGKKLAAQYLLKKENVKDLMEIGSSFAKAGDREGAAIFLWPLVKYYFEKSEIDNAIKTLDALLPPAKVWNCVLHLLRKNAHLMLESGMIAFKVLDNIKRELKEISTLEILLQLIGKGIGKSSKLSRMIRAVGAALHLGCEHDAINESLGLFLRVAVNNGDMQTVLAIFRVPGVQPVLQKLLEETLFLNASTPIKIQPGSNHHAHLLFLRGLYHYKRGRCREMSQDFISSCFISTNQDLPEAIGKFIASNTMIHERLLKRSCRDFDRIQDFIENHTGVESLDTSMYPEVLQSTEVDLTPNLSLVFNVSSKSKDGRKLPNVGLLEKDILGRKEEDEDADEDEDDDEDDNEVVRPSRSNGALTSSEYAERGYSYVDLEIICYSKEDTISCLSMAAHHFLKAMMTTPDQSFEEKFAYRGLVLECAKEFSAYCGVLTGSPIIALYSTRVMQSFILKANHHFSQVLQLKQPVIGGAGFIDEDTIPETSRAWQNLLNLRLLCPLISSEIYMIAEGKIVLYSMQLMEKALLLQRVHHESFSKNVEQHLSHHYLFQGLWLGKFNPEETGYEEEIPDLPIDKAQDPPEEKQRKRLIKAEIEEKLRIRNETPLIHREGFRIAKENSMEVLAHLFGYDLDEVENMMKWHCIRRTEDGFMDIRNRNLNFDGQNYIYSKFLGVQINPVTHTCSLLLEPASASKPALFSAVDLFEIFGFQIEDAILSFDEQFSCDVEGREQKDYAKLPFSFNPFFKVRFLGIGPGGCASKERICGTNFLMTLYHLDLLAKILTTGQEISSKFPFNQRNTEEHLLSNLSKEMKDILKPIGERKKAVKLRPIELIHRFWFHVEEVEQNIEHASVENGGNFTFRFDNVKMSLKTMPMWRKKDGSLEDANQFDQDTPEAQFVQEFNENMERIGKVFPILERTKELAKIAAAFSVMNRNKDTFSKDNPAFQQLMAVNNPCARPYSKCHWNGSVKASQTCKCSSWVPAVYHYPKVTQEQKLEYLFSRKFSKGKENAISGKEAGNRLLFSNEEFYSQKGGKDNNGNADGLDEGESKDADGGDGPSSSSVNWNLYDLLEQYKVYGGVQFQANIKNVAYLPRSGTYVPSRSFMSMHAPPAYMTRPPAGHSRIPMPPPPPSSTGGNSNNRSRLDYVGTSYVYMITPTTGNLNMWQGKIGISSVPLDRNGALQRAHRQVQRLNRQADQTKSGVYYKYSVVKVYDTRAEARTYEGRMTNKIRGMDLSNLPLEKGCHNPYK